MSTDDTPWFPLFEFQDWLYQSFLLLPTPAETDAAAGSPVTAKKWGKGELMCGQAFKTTEGYTLGGTLVFRPGFSLSVDAHGAQGLGRQPGTFIATGTGIEGPLKGAISRLVGWVFPEEPVANGAARVLCVRGSIWAVRGTDADPGKDPSGLPLGTVGAFTITRAAGANGSRS